VRDFPRFLRAPWRSPAATVLALSFLIAAAVLPANDELASLILFGLGTICFVITVFFAWEIDHTVRRPFKH
jgi:hypothetical protein